MASTNNNNKDIFTLFDKRGQGAIPREAVGDYLRAIGFNPTNKLVGELVAASASASGSSSSSSGQEAFSLADLEALVAHNQQALDATTAGKPDDFIRAFQVFDKEDTGKVAVGDLRYMLTGLGEKLSDEEVDELLKGVEVDADGRIDYKKFIEDILRQ